MIPPRALGEGIAVTGKVGPEDIPAIALHFRTLINNRPDGEDPGQATSADIAAAAARAGLDYLHLPVIPGQIGEDQVRQFAKALAERKHPVLAFCRSGMRSASLWALAQPSALSSREILAAAASAGFDLATLEPRLRARAK